MPKLVFRKPVNLNTRRDKKTEAMYTAMVSQSVKLNIWYFDLPNVFGFAFIKDDNVSAGGICEESWIQTGNRKFTGVVERFEDNEETSVLEIEVIDENSLDVSLLK